MADRIAAILLLIFAIYTMAAARDMGFARGRVPGPGFAPFWIGLALAVAAIAILIESRRKPRSVQDGGDVSSPAHQVFAMAAATIAAVALIGPLGMFAALALMLVTMTRVLGAAWRTSVVTAVVLPLALHLVFGTWLKVPLPRGPWGF
ncbi:MAG TPA: tripartite tricarboxylate transporter TctB family protein [bacterium]|nr:tripartite tricarboxylate transporter TctB family protein [bacterium]